jgi:hypothetical protein
MMEEEIFMRENCLDIKGQEETEKRQINLQDEEDCNIIKHFYRKTDKVQPEDKSKEASQIQICVNEQIDKTGGNKYEHKKADSKNKSKDTDFDKSGKVRRHIMNQQQIDRQTKLEEQHGTQIDLKLESQTSTEDLTNDSDEIQFIGTIIKRKSKNGFILNPFKKQRTL